MGGLQGGVLGGAVAGPATYTCLTIASAGTLTAAALPAAATVATIGAVSATAGGIIGMFKGANAPDTTKAFEEGIFFGASVGFTMAVAGAQGDSTREATRE